MNKINKFSTCLLAFTAMSVAAQAQQLMSLQDCIDFALANNEKLQIASLSVDRATDLKGTAFDISPTAITLQQETTGSAGMDNGVSFSQDFDFPTVYVAKHKALKAQVEHEQNNYAIARNETVRDVTAAYYSLLYYRELLRINQAQDTLYRKFLDIANARFKAGECSKLEPMNAERLVNTNNVALKTAQNDFDAAQARLMYLLNSQTAIEPSDEQLTIIPSEIAPSALDFDNSPQGRATQSEIAMNERNLSVAKQQFLPGFTIGATAQAMIKSFNPYDVERNRFEKGNFMGFEVGVTVPLFFGAQRARAKAAKKDLEISRVKQDVARKEAQTEYEAALNRLNTATQNLEYYTTSGIQQGLEIARLADVSYSLGDISYVEYIDNIETAYDMQRSYADAINQYNSTKIYLNYLIGKQ
jgi:cobalt-zinc-cadmium resistance protein CzcA